MSGATLEYIERELEMAAELLESGASTSQLWRYWDVWFLVNGSWERQHKVGPVKDTRDNALKIRDAMERQWRPIAAGRGVTLLVRCLTWSSNRWVNCRDLDA